MYDCGKKNSSFFWFNIRLSNLRPELAACYFSFGLISQQGTSLRPWELPMIVPGPLGLCRTPASLTTQDDLWGWANLPFKTMLLRFSLTCLVLVAILGKNTEFGMDLSLKVLGLYLLKLEESKTQTSMWR